MDEIDWFSSESIYNICTILWTKLRMKEAETLIEIAKNKDEESKKTKKKQQGGL